MLFSHFCFLFIFLFACIGSVCAQDTILKRNGDEVYCHVKEIGTKEVKFKLASVPDGPVYKLFRSEIFMIRLAGGSKEVFNDLPPQPEEIKPGIIYRNKNCYIGIDRISWGHATRLILESGNADAVKEMQEAIILHRGLTRRGFMCMALTFGGAGATWVTGIATLFAYRDGGTVLSALIVLDVVGLITFGGGLYSLTTIHDIRAKVYEQRKKAVDAYNHRLIK